MEVVEMSSKIEIGSKVWVELRDSDASGERLVVVDNIVDDEERGLLVTYDVEVNGEVRSKWAYLDEVRGENESPRRWW